MSKELEALNEFLKDKVIKEYILYNCLDDNVVIIRNSLKRLEAIDNANPSEALELFKEFKGILLEEVVLLDTDLQSFNTIEQALLKAQEPKKYLKWDDLDTKPYTMKVKMGDNLYMLDWRYSNDDDYDNSKSVTLRALNGDWLFNLERYFFNDLHLEVSKK